MMSMRTPMEPVTVEPEAKTRSPAMLTMRPREAAAEPMETARGFFLPSAFRAI